MKGLDFTALKNAIEEETISYRREFLKGKKGHFFLNSYIEYPTCNNGETVCCTYNEETDNCCFRKVNTDGELLAIDFDEEQQNCIKQLMRYVDNVVRTGSASKEAFRIVKQNNIIDYSANWLTNVINGLNGDLLSMYI